MHTPLKGEDICDKSDTVSKSNSFTLGEVRQALNNGMLDDILPMGGPVYRVNSLKDTNNIELSVNDVINPNDSQVIKYFNNISCYRIVLFDCYLTIFYS